MFAAIGGTLKSTTLFVVKFYYNKYFIIKIHACELKKNWECVSRWYFISPIRMFHGWFIVDLGNTKLL